MSVGRLSKNQFGDTIVEVLIAIAIISAVLGSAYAITNRNVENSQQAQEHSQALKVAESQLEQLRSYANAGNDISTINNFCMNNGGVKANTDPLCKVSDNPGDNRYAASITNSSNTFTASITWNGPTGGNDQVSLVYKVFP